MGLNGAGAGHGGQGGKGPEHGGGLYYSSVTHPRDFGRPARAEMGGVDDAIGGGVLEFQVENSFTINGQLINCRYKTSIHIT